MIGLAHGIQIHLCTEPTDMRRGFDGLSGMIVTLLEQDPLSGHLFVFRNRNRDKLKILYWDNDGLAIWYKRLEQGTFQFPTDGKSRDQLTAGVAITTNELSLLLGGIDLHSARKRQSLDAKEQTIRELLQALRGKTRERIDPDQLLLFDIGELETLIEEELQAEQESRRPKRKRKRGRRLIPDNIPTEVIEHTVAEEDRLCPVDGQPMPLIRWEENTQLDYVPAKVTKLVHRRAVYACPEKHDEAKLITAPKPPQPIEKGLPTAGLLSQVVVSKFGDHLPGYRQEDIFARHGIEIRRNTIYGWLAQVADLCQPLYELMVELVLASKVIHTDDTQVKLIDHSIQGTRLARFWGYLGDINHPYAVYDFTTDRSRAGPQKFLSGFTGYLQADAYPRGRLQ